MRVAIIPARGGSVRIPRKNVLPFKGRPMLMYPITAAQESGLFDLIVVSTDDPEIAQVAFACNAVVIRRPEDDGTTGTQEIAARVLDQLDAHGSACVIYATSPLLLPQDLKRGLDTMLKPDNLTRSFCMSVREWQREDGTTGWEDAGCFYWGWAKAFRDRVPLDEATTAHVALPGERVQDINVPSDWARAEFLFEQMTRSA